MNTLVDQFIGLDPILGNEAKDDLIKHGENSLDLVISRFGSLDRTLSLEIRLGELFGHFGVASVDRLINVLQTGKWHNMIDASLCFRNLPQEPAASKLADLLSNNSNIDIERCTIDALGYLGAKDWSFILFDLFPFRSGLKSFDKGYRWQKLSYNVFIALLRMATKEEEEGNVFAHYRLSDIERFYEIAGDVDYRNLISRGAWYDMLFIFTNFKSSAADAIIREWLNNENLVLQKIALKSLKPMRLNRIEGVLRNYLEMHKEDDEIKSHVAEVLSDIPSKKAAETVKYIFSITEENSTEYKSICLNLAICLDRLDDKSFVEQTYPHLLGMGGEIAAHTYYNLGLLGYEENVWSEAINSEDFIVRAAVSLIYAYSKGAIGIQRLLQMERESSHDIEQLLILSALIKAGLIKKQGFLIKIAGGGRSPTFVVTTKQNHDYDSLPV